MVFPIIMGVGALVSFVTSGGHFLARNGSTIYNHLPGARHLSGARHVSRAGAGLAKTMSVSQLAAKAKTMFSQFTSGMSVGLMACMFVILKVLTSPNEWWILAGLVIAMCVVVAIYREDLLKWIKTKSREFKKLISSCCLFSLGHFMFDLVLAIFLSSVLTDWFRTTELWRSIRPEIEFEKTDWIINYLFHERWEEVYQEVKRTPEVVPFFFAFLLIGLYISGLAWLLEDALSAQVYTLNRRKIHCDDEGEVLKVLDKAEEWNGTDWTSCAAEPAYNSSASGIKIGDVIERVGSNPFSKKRLERAERSGSDYVITVRAGETESEGDGGEDPQNSQGSVKRCCCCCYRDDGEGSEHHENIPGTSPEHPNVRTSPEHPQNIPRTSPERRTIQMSEHPQNTPTAPLVSGTALGGVGSTNAETASSDVAANSQSRCKSPCCRSNACSLFVKVSFMSIVLTSLVLCFQIGLFRKFEDFVETFQEIGENISDAPNATMAVDTVTDQRHAMAHSFCHFTNLDDEITQEVFPSTGCKHEESEKAIGWMRNELKENNIYCVSDAEAQIADFVCAFHACRPCKHGHIRTIYFEGQKYQSSLVTQICLTILMILKTAYTCLCIYPCLKEEVAESKSQPIVQSDTSADVVVLDTSAAPRSEPGLCQMGGYTYVDNTNKKNKFHVAQVGTSVFFVDGNNVRMGKVTGKVFEVPGFSKWTGKVQDSGNVEFNDFTWTKKDKVTMEFTFDDTDYNVWDGCEPLKKNVKTEIEKLVGSLSKKKGQAADPEAQFDHVEVELFKVEDVVVELFKGEDSKGPFSPVGVRIEITLDAEKADSVVQDLSEKIEKFPQDVIDRISETRPSNKKLKVVVKDKARKGIHSEYQAP